MPIQETLAERVGIRWRGWLCSDRAVQLCRCLTIARAFCQHFTPEPFGLGMIASLGGNGGQIAPGKMPVNPLTDAAKLVLCHS
jgi:hypothetical protein